MILNPTLKSQVLFSQLQKDKLETEAELGANRLELRSEGFYDDFFN